MIFAPNVQVPSPREIGLEYGAVLETEERARLVADLLREPVVAVPDSDALLRGSLAEGRDDLWRVDLDLFARSAGRDPDSDRDNPAARGGPWSTTESSLANVIAAQFAGERTDHRLTFIESVTLRGSATLRRGIEQRRMSVTDQRNPLATALGTYYPRHYVVAVIHDPASATKALAALREEGFADAAAEICPGPEFIKNWSDFIAHRGPLARIADLYPAEEHSAVEEYLAEAENGASFVTVHATAMDDRNRARDILRNCGGHSMRYYGDRTITDLD